MNTEIENKKKVAEIQDISTGTNPQDAHSDGHSDEDWEKIGTEEDDGVHKIKKENTQTEDSKKQDEADGDSLLKEIAKLNLEEGEKNENKKINEQATKEESTKNKWKESIKQKCEVKSSLVDDKSAKPAEQSGNLESETKPEIDPRLPSILLWERLEKNRSLQELKKAPEDYPTKLTLKASGFRGHYSNEHIIKLFSDYGKITHYQRENGGTAVISYVLEAEANAAIKAANNFRILGRNIRVQPIEEIKDDTTPRESMVYLYNISKSATVRDIKNHFSTCGEIVKIRNYRCKMGTQRKIYFDTNAAAKAALDLNESVLKDSTIVVRPPTRPMPIFKDGCSIVVFNDGYTKAEASKIIDVISKCGKVSRCDLLLNKHKLAIVGFENATAAKEALKLNNTTAGQRIIIKVKPYTHATFGNTKILVKNLADDTTDISLYNKFISCGRIDKLMLSTIDHIAVIEFSDTDGYCNAMALNGELFKKQRLYVKPFQQENFFSVPVCLQNEVWVSPELQFQLYLKNKRQKKACKCGAQD